MLIHTLPIAADGKTTMRPIVITLLFAGSVFAQDGSPIVRCEVVPLPRHEVSLQVDGVERLRWHHGDQYERPFFFPFLGPSGTSLTRVGHPGAENHDHHRSIWLAHHDVNGESFWANSSAARIRQKHWYRYLDGEDEAIMAVRLGWYDSSGAEVMDSDLVAALRPLGGGEQTLELQLNLRPGESRDAVTLGKTNFGLLAVRVAKSISTVFGDGRICDSEGRSGEAEIFGKSARWMDYSGTVAVGQGTDRTATIEGITYFDHPDNPRYPTHWHVRQDGWMGASFCMHEGLTIHSNQPLTLRYLLHAHRGSHDRQRAESMANEFSLTREFRIEKSSQPHRQYEVRRHTGG